MLLVAKLRVVARRDEMVVHAVADKHLSAMTVAVMYGFLRGRKAYKSGGIGTSSGAKAAVSAVRAALLVSLPLVLLKAVVAGGNAGIAMLPRRRAASAMRTLKPFDIRFDATSEEAIVMISSMQLETRPEPR